MEAWECSFCGASDYSTNGTQRVTAVYYPPRIVNGVNVNPDRNKRTEERHCNACGVDATVTWTP